MIVNEDRTLEKVVLAGVDTGEDENFELSLEELEDLAKACDMEVMGAVTQTVSEINKATCMGAGKVEFLKEFARDMEAETVIFDNTLSPMQMKNLQDELGLAVMDRTGLILEIFNRRAGSNEAKLQVESARLKYMLPRLAGMRTNLGRQGGGSGSRSNKGAGEKKIELDRRAIEHRISVLRKELKEVSKDKETQRKKRQNDSIRQVALVGYTNAGKSTILNSMVDCFGEAKDKKVFEKDMLFATLDTSVRKISIKDKEDFFLSDTVGFIHKLPHGLVEAFKSTLSEVLQADLLLHVVDFSDENFKQHINVTKETLNEIGAGGIPTIYVYNKCDKKPGIYKDSDDSLYISAKNKGDIERLTNAICEKLYSDYEECEFNLPYSMGSALNVMRNKGRIIESEYRDDCIFVRANCSKALKKSYSDFLVMKESV